ncbi:MAG: hypothetical protein LH649_09360 [Pseudanabaena sp. CAN_BIN31]|nr:hypothetical protein [Pseudanabaena sp. CAN_BIN31]
MKLFNFNFDLIFTILAVCCKGWALLDFWLFNSDRLILGLSYFGRSHFFDDRHSLDAGGADSFYLYFYLITQWGMPSAPNP